MLEFTIRQWLFFGVDIVIKETTGLLIVKLIEEYLAGVGKGRMPDVIVQGDGLDQVQVQGTADGSGDPGRKGLHRFGSSFHIQCGQTALPKAFLLP